MDKNGLVFSIERGSVHDGPGLRTTVFLKGCPLHCLWCHNPESQCFSPELYFFEEKCTLCGACVPVCPNKCHSIKDGVHSINRAACTARGKCVDACLWSALEIKGRLMNSGEVMEIVKKDRAYYAASGGGLTLSGGEPMSQFDFAYELLGLSRQSGIHTCIETSGFAPTEKFEKIAEVVDLFLFDYKESDDEKHIQYMGADQKLILQNLFALDRLGAKIVLRCPVIPHLNDRPEHLKAIAELAEKLVNITEVNIMAYHPMGQSKSKRLGKEYPLQNSEFAPKDQVENWIAFIKENTSVPVRKG